MSEEYVTRAEVGHCQQCWVLVRLDLADKHRAWHNDVDGWIERYEEYQAERAEYEE